MNVFAIVLAVAVTIAGAILFTRKGEAATMENKNDLDALFRLYGEQYGVDPLLLKAIAMVESSLRPDAVRWNPPHDVSVGVMQILCTPPKEADGSQDYVCQNRFDVSPWPVKFFDLKNPALNIRIGAQILSWNLRTFGFPRGIAVFNSWSARHASVAGPFPNQSYVDKVLRNFSQLKEKTV